MSPSYFPQNPTAPWRVMVPKRWSPTRKRRPHYFKSEELAHKFCQHVTLHGIHYADHYEDKRPKGSAPILAKQELNQWQSAVQVCVANLGNDISLLYKAVDHFKTTQLNIKLGTTDEVIAAFNKARLDSAAGVDPEVSAKTCRTDRSRLKTLSQSFGRQSFSTITEVQLREYFQRLKLKRNPRSIYKTVKTLFGWAVKFRYLVENPMDKIEPQGEFGINKVFYPNEYFHRIIRIAAGLDPEFQTDEFIDLLPWLVLGGFGGLRTCEIAGRPDALRWTDLHFDGLIPSIEIREEVSKTGDLRQMDLPHALEAIKAWLDLYRSVSPLKDFVCPISEHTLTILKTKFTKVTGLVFQDNALRKSFATYGLAYDLQTGGNDMAKQLGHDERVLHKNYAKRLPSGSGLGWFKLRPDTDFGDNSQDERIQKVA
jgi:integrase